MGDSSLNLHAELFLAKREFFLMFRWVQCCNYLDVRSLWYDATAIGECV
jgi:hypothetical protein